MTTPVSREERWKLQTEKARGSLVSAMLGLLQDKSVEEISTREIATRSKCNISSISYHFGGKFGLYKATILKVTEIIAEDMAPFFIEGEKHYPFKTISREDAIVLLKKLIRRSILLNQSSSSINSIIAREQVKPTEAFDILFDGVLHKVNQYGSALVARALGSDEITDRHRIRFHALIGETLAFRFTRESIRRALHWEAIGPAENECIAEMIEQHIDLIIGGLAATSRLG